MQYLSFISAVDTFVLASLAVVLACGAYDSWVEPK
jgi:uncharacterized membrane protein YqhA